MLTPLGRTVFGIFGAAEFWREFKTLMEIAREEGRTYMTTTVNAMGMPIAEAVPWLTYDEYDYLFDVAVKTGVVAVYDDGNGKPLPQFASPAGMGLLTLWREVQTAREMGLEAKAFAVRYDARIEARLKARREETQAEDRAAAARREQAVDDLRARRGGTGGKKIRDAKTAAAGGWD